MKPGEHPMSPEAASGAIKILRGFRYYPKENDQFDALVGELLLDMCPSAEAAAWVVRRAFQLWNSEWKGPKELRALLCSKYRPADGVSGFTELFPEGIPSERGLPSPPSYFKRLPPGSVTSNLQLVSGATQEIVPGPHRMEELPERTPEERRQHQAFERLLEETITDPKLRDEEPIRRKPIRQSEIISANGTPDPEDAPRPAGTYKPITADDFKSIPRAEIEKWKKKG